MLRPASKDTGPAASTADFVAGLQNEQAALITFTDLLRAEQDALVQGDVDRLGQLAVPKADQIELLGRLGERRSRHLAAQDLNGSAEGILAWLRRSVGAAAEKIWQELLAQARAAQQINATNGLLIQSKLQQNRLKLAVLHTAADSGCVYRSDGQLGPLRGTKSLSQV